MSDAADCRPNVGRRRRHSIRETALVTREMGGGLNKSGATARLALLPEARQGSFTTM